LRAELGIASKWDLHRHRMSFASLLGRLVDGRSIVGPVGRDGCYREIDLEEFS